MRVRPLTRYDKPGVMELIAATNMFTSEERDIAEEVIDVYLDEPDHDHYDVRVLEDDHGVTVAYVCFGPTPMTDGTFDLYWIAVHPNERRKGYGKILIESVEKWVEEQKGRLIMIETSSQKAYLPTRQFYERLGYVETARIRDFYRSGEDLVIYCKYLRWRKAS